MAVLVRLLIVALDVVTVELDEAEVVKTALEAAEAEAEDEPPVDKV